MVQWVSRFELFYQDQRYWDYAQQLHQHPEMTKLTKVSFQMECDRYNHRADHHAQRVRATGGSGGSARTIDVR